jgi:hypothetical protein
LPALPPGLFEVCWPTIRGWQIFVHFFDAAACPASHHVGGFVKARRRAHR